MLKKTPHGASMTKFQNEEEKAMDCMVKEMMTCSFEKYGKDQCLEALKLSRIMSLSDVARQLNVKLTNASNMILAGGKYEVDELVKGFSYQRENCKDCLKAECDGKISMVRGDGAYLCDKCHAVYRRKS